MSRDCPRPDPASCLHCCLVPLRPAVNPHHPQHPWSVRLQRQHHAHRCMGQQHQPAGQEGCCGWHWGQCGPADTKAAAGGTGACGVPGEFSSHLTINQLDRVPQPAGTLVSADVIVVEGCRGCQKECRSGHWVRIYCRVRQLSKHTYSQAQSGQGLAHITFGMYLLPCP